MIDADESRISKISVRIWRPIIKKLDDKLNAACLRRDAYLAKVLDVELDHLDREVAVANSEASFDYVFKELDQFDRKLVSLALPATLTKRIGEVCARKRIVRDAFFNRLFLLLAASPATIDSLLFGVVGPEWRATVWSDYKHEGPFFQNGFYPLEPSIDPFWAVRAGLDHYAEAEGLGEHLDPVTGQTIRGTMTLSGRVLPADSLYTTWFPQSVGRIKLVGMSCYLPDWRVPGHEAEAKEQAKLDELLADMVALP